MQRAASNHLFCGTVEVIAWGFVMHGSVGRELHFQAVSAVQL
jgi:hypothetical protein